MAANDKINRLQDDVNEVTHLLHNNMEKVLERGDKLDNLQARSDYLEAEAKQFKVSSKKIKQKYCCQNARTCLCLIIVIVVILLVIAGVIVLAVVQPWKDDSGGSKNSTLTTWIS